MPWLRRARIASVESLGRNRQWHSTPGGSFEWNVLNVAPQRFDGGSSAWASSAKGVTLLEEVSLVLLDAYEAARNSTEVRGKKVGATQKYHDLSLLKRFFAWCLERDLLDKNLLEGKRISRPTPRRRSVIPTIEHVDRILEALPKRIHAPVAVLAFGGMRSANCRNLLVSDIDLECGWIQICSREGAETKGGNEWRVPVHPRLKKILSSLRLAKSGYVFTSPPSRKYPLGGHWISTKHLNDDFVKVVKKLGMPAGREA